VVNDDEAKCTYKQIGITSYGVSGCGKIGFPGLKLNIFEIKIHFSFFVIRYLHKYIPLFGLD